MKLPAVTCQHQCRKNRSIQRQATKVTIAKEATRTMMRMMMRDSRRKIYWSTLR